MVVTFADTAAVLSIVIKGIGFWSLLPKLLERGNDEVTCLGKVGALQVQAATAASA